MPSQPPIPPLLSLVLSPDSLLGSLTLLASTLVTSTNWLVLRLLYVTLKGRESDKIEERSAWQPGGTGVVLASWLRDWSFWRDGGRRLVSMLASLGSMHALESVDLATEMLMYV